MAWYTSRRKLNEQIVELIAKNNDLAHYINDIKEMFPLILGDTVYDVQLRSAKGRFTKTKASREHSLINEVVVDKKNYFSLVDRYKSNDVFFTYVDAEKHLNDVCVD